MKKSNFDFAACQISPEAARKLPYQLMKRHCVIPIEIDDDKLLIAVPPGLNGPALDEIKRHAGMDLEILQIDRRAIQDRLAQIFHSVGETAPRYSAVDDEVVPQQPTDNSIIGLVNHMLDEAIHNGVSDIHIEPQEHECYIRFRIDGMLTTVKEINKLLEPALCSRLKVMAQMDIAEKRLPQDNHFSMSLKSGNIEFRVSTLPGKYGEKIVIRVLNKSGFSLDLNQMGMDPVLLSTFETMIQKPQGLILVTGPTGSGKTTTLYSVLNRLISSKKNIITLEDPVEYDLLSGKDEKVGIHQVPINHKIGMTFATALRSALRQDPDIIMVGEVRDRDTAEIAMRSALTGHMVLSTLHTNDSFSTVLRLKNMGIEPYLIGATVTGVIAQRLVRTLCPNCKMAYRPPIESLKRLFSAWDPGMENLMLFKAVGCGHCHESGYSGRRGIFELLSMNEALAEYILTEKHPDSANPVVKATILRTLRESGLELVKNGETTVEEIFRITAG